MQPTGSPKHVLTYMHVFHVTCVDFDTSYILHACNINTNMHVCVGISVITCTDAKKVACMYVVTIVTAVSNGYHPAM